MLPVAIFAQAFTTQLQELDLSSVTQGWSVPHKNQSVDEHPLTIAGQKFSTGIGTHAVSDIRLKLDGGAFSFGAKCGLDDETGERGSVEFIVMVDKVIKWRSGVMKHGDAAKTIEVSGTGKELRLLVTDGGDGIDYDHADWIAPVLVSRSKPVVYKAPKVPPMPINTSIPSKAWIHGPHVVGGTPGKPFVFRIPASGDRPMKFETHTLPAGLKMDPSTGVISGKLPMVPASGQSMHFMVNVSNAKGKDSREYTLMFDGNPSPTPPMGWNSWNVWGLDVTAEHVEAAADSFLKYGLADFGFRTVNIDDGWEQGRDASGEIQVNKKFGDMSDLANRIHGKGLRLGIYSSPGPKTCGGYEGSWQHEAQDANTYAKWGIDYLKYDWCSYGNISKGENLQELEKPYILMHDALKASSRDITFSLCQYGMGDVWKWGHEVGGNCWRTTGDINDSWGSLKGITFAQPDMKRPADSTGYNDPDMLVVGYLGWSKNIRPTRLTGDEQITHITAWSILSAPLLLGCDLTRIDKFTKALLTNHDVVEMDQEYRPKQVEVLSKSSDAEVWARRLNNGQVAIALFNKSDEPMSISVPWASLPHALKSVRDIWLQKEISKKDPLTRKVPAHGANYFLLTPTMRTR